MNPASRLLATCFAAVLAGNCLSGIAQSAAPDVSPFLPAAGAASTASTAAPKAYELEGVSTTSRGTQVCIYDVQGKHSHWIEVGKTVGDVQVVSYDSASGQAVIAVRGSQMSLAMRKATFSNAQGAAGLSIAIQPAAPNPAPTAVLPPTTVGAAQPTPPQTEQAKQEREARMLVSDLLEIGMQQRKAYEEAQKKAQQSGKGN
jgi:hypothetical protein